MTSLTKNLDSVTADRDAAALMAQQAVSRSDISRTSTEMYSKVVIENALQLDRLQREIEHLRHDMAEQERELVRCEHQCFCFQN